MKKTRGSGVALVVLLVSSLACMGPREPGPLEEEWGQVLFWEVERLETSSVSCTDAPDFTEALTLPPLEQNTFFMVRISNDGQSATATECEETRAETCTDIEDLTFSVDGHLLEHEEPLQTIDSGLGCNVSLRALWSMVDDGETGVLEVALTFPFEGDEDACRTLDDGIADQGMNDFGLAGCEVLLTADLLFVVADG